MKYLKIMGLFAAAMSLPLLAACGGGSKNNNAPSQPPVNITITPTLTMLVGESKPLNVTAQNTDFTVSVVPASGSGCEKSGSNAVACTPAAAGTYTVTVTATADATKKATAQVIVTEPEEENEIEIVENADGINEILSADGTTHIPITFTAADSWTASIDDAISAGAVTLFSAQDDCDVSPKSGAAGDSITVNVTCTPNDTGANRVVNLTISTENDQLVVPITQKPTPLARYTAIEYPGAESTWIEAINNSGQIVGNFYDSAYNVHYFLYDSKTGSYTEINPPGSVTDIAGINDSGQVIIGAGYNDGVYGYLYDSKTGSYTAINPPGATASTVSEINNSGQVIGAFYDSAEDRYCYLYDNTTGTYTVINPPGATGSISVSGINASGQVIGRFRDSSNKNSYYLYDSKKENYTVINPPGSISANLSDGIVKINNSGQVIGKYRDSAERTYGYLYDNATGSYTVIDPPGYDPSALDLSVSRINDSGQVIVGFDTSSGGYEGFLYDSTTGSYTRIDLPGLSGVVPSEINNSGQVVGYDDRNYGFLYDGDRFIEFAHPGAASIYASELQINDSGQIIGIYSDDYWNYYWFLLEFEGL